MKKEDCDNNLQEDLPTAENTIGKEPTGEDIEELSPEELAVIEQERLAQDRRDDLVNYIYHQTGLSKVTGEKELKLSPPGNLTKEELEELLAEVASEQKHEDLEDIRFIQGKKDLYYYDISIMTAHYAQIDVMLQDKDILHTIGETTRFDSKTYPRPTQFRKLRTTPFAFTQDEILGAVARMKMEPDYEDIDTVTASNGEKATFSTLYMSKKYAQALIESIEVEEPNNP